VESKKLKVAHVKRGTVAVAVAVAAAVAVYSRSNPKLET